MSIKEPHLASHIANADAIHEAQNRAIELSKQAGNGPVRMVELRSLLSAAE